MKREIRVIGFDDGPFTPRSRGNALVVGVVTRGGEFVDGVLRIYVKIDGLDATKVLSDAINNSKHKPQLRVIMLNGITIAGFNLIDIEELFEKTSLPVIVVNRKRPNMKKFKEALKNFEDFEKRWKIVKKAGPIKKVEVKDDKFIYFQASGIEDIKAAEVIKLTCTHSLIPEPLRLAHLIASAMVKGESGGRP
ncbi:MAG: DUF99 family protein [Candidatus Aenigmarchaeota archaeon]|nr:DUF99 family protein [Candidatus Aenigmarchaeota archaeon]